MNDKKRSIETDALKTREALDQLSVRRSQGISKAKVEQTHQQKARERERRKLLAKYGAKDSRLQKMDRKLATQARLQEAIQESEKRSAQSRPKPDVNQWSVSGTVRDEAGLRQEGLTVSLFTEEGQWARALGYDCTDQNGDYQLQVTDESLLKEYKGQPLYLGVTDDERTLLHAEQEAVTVRKGQVQNRDIFLPEERCGTAPEGVDLGKETEEGLVVYGVVRGANGQPLAGLRVRAVDQDFTKDDLLGEEQRTDEKGAYRIEYRREDFVIEGKETTGADIIVLVFDEDGELIHQSKAHPDAPTRLRIDIDLDR
ncbi:MAG: hypothetical protein AAFV25_04805 [Bacteroidota bacterium]